MPDEDDWERNIPNTDLWLPRVKKSERLSVAMLERCKKIESRIMQRVADEIDDAIDNFDSGAGVEDILREELTALFPNRYSFLAGTINDRNGRTAGDSEIVIVDERWFPTMKPGATSVSRRIHFPIESVFGVIEVKQTLSLATLDAALEKLVVVHRLERARTDSNRLTENRVAPIGSGARSSEIGNPLFSAVVASRLASGTTFEEISARFELICKKLHFTEAPHCVCVLGVGNATFGLRGTASEEPMADFDFSTGPPDGRVHLMRQLNTLGGSALHSFATRLLRNLTHQVLPAPDRLMDAYANETYVVNTHEDPTTFASSRLEDRGSEKN